jgi:hypothetical protein
MCFGGKKSAPAAPTAPADPPNPNNQAANNNDQQRRSAITAANTISTTDNILQGNDTLGNPANTSTR